MSQAATAAFAESRREQASSLGRAGKLRGGDRAGDPNPESSQVVIPADDVMLAGLDRSVLIVHVCVLKVLGAFWGENRVWGLPKFKKKVHPVCLVSSKLNLPLEFCHPPWNVFLP